MFTATQSSTQWLFPISALENTPTEWALQKELYDRARGVEFLFRLGSSLQLPTSAMLTAATWFHRFYMRFSMEHYHRQEVAAACIFLATKTEECGRKLRDVAKIYCSKVSNVPVLNVPNDSKEVEQCQTGILLTEEALLEALCFDFLVISPHADLVNLFETFQDDPVCEYAWSIAHDSYRTPLCVLYSPDIIAAACFILAQYYVDGPNSISLDARVSLPAPSASLPTPPSHKSASPVASRSAIDFFGFNEGQVHCVADALSILVEFYSAQDVEIAHPYLAVMAAIPPPSSTIQRPRFFVPAAHLSQLNTTAESQTSEERHGRTPISSDGGNTPSHMAPDGRIADKPGPRVVSRLNVV
ncbi:cyclin family protein [Pleurotus pulmonarius]